MVESTISIEFLAGVAITVFLALVFFAVVVLWDIALAIRSVGDKLDRLEDSVDDDLREIGYSLETVSSAQSGGTQLHLSGGSVSAGADAPAAERAVEPTATRGGVGVHGTEAGTTTESPSRPVGGEPAEVGTADGETGPDATVGPAETGDPEPNGNADGSEPGDVGEGENEADRTEDEVDEPEDEVEGAEEAADGPEDGADGPEGEADEAGNAADEPEDGVESETDDGDGSDETEGGTDEATPAAVNRRRFVASGEGRPWYALSLERGGDEEIAGALEAPDPIDDREVIVVGPPGSHTERTDGGPTPPTDDGRATEGEVSTLGEPSSSGSAFEGAPPSGAASVDSPMGEPSEPEPSTDVGGSSPDESPTGDASSADGSLADDPEDTGAESPGGAASAGGASVGEPPVGVSGPADGPPAEGDGEGAEGTEPSQSAVSGIESPTEDDPEGTLIEDEPEETLIEDDPEETVIGDDPEETVIGDDPEEALTVEEAVEGVNEDAPTPSLSSREFSLSATEDGDDVVLVFEFDPAVVDVTGSTRRLLSYQLGSFAGQESTPDGEVTVEDRRVVIEIPEPEGVDVARWSEAAVSIVDRTLYLSEGA